MGKRIKENNASRKNYLETSIFYSSLLLIDVALIVYNLWFIQKFKAANQVFYPVTTDASFFEKIADRYFSFFAKFFGNYPSTKVLAVTIPLAFVLLIWFLDDYTKYLKQKARQKAALCFPEAPAQETDSRPADEAGGGAVRTNPDIRSNPDDNPITDDSLNTDKPDENSDGDGAHSPE